MINFEIKKSDIAGVGVFAKENIISGKKIGLGFQKIYDTGASDIDYVRTKLGEKINHSQNPNIQLQQDGENFYFVALRDIKSGEELFLDYENIPWEGKRGFK